MNRICFTKQKQGKQTGPPKGNQHKKQTARPKWPYLSNVTSDDCAAQRGALHPPPGRLATPSLTHHHQVDGDPNLDPSPNLDLNLNPNPRWMATSLPLRWRP